MRRSTIHRPAMHLAAATPEGAILPFLASHSSGTLSATANLQSRHSRRGCFTSFGAATRAVSFAKRVFTTSRVAFDQPFYTLWAMPSRRHSSTFAQCLPTKGGESKRIFAVWPPSAIPIFSSAEDRSRVAWRTFLITLSPWPSGVPAFCLVSTRQRRRLAKKPLPPNRPNLPLWGQPWADGRQRRGVSYTIFGPACRASAGRPNFQMLERQTFFRTQILSCSVVSLL